MRHPSGPLYWDDEGYLASRDHGLPYGRWACPCCGEVAKNRRDIDHVDYCERHKKPEKP